MADRALEEFLRVGEPACPRCGHGLSGLNLAICPECGAPLALRLTTSDAPKIQLRASWVLWWLVAEGVGTASHTLWICWLMFEPMRDFYKTMNQEGPSFVRFVFENNTGVNGAATALLILLALGAAVLLALSRTRPGSPAVRRAVVCFCGCSLFAHAALWMVYALA
jgi:hypothetical protein